MAAISVEEQALLAGVVLEGTVNNRYNQGTEGLLLYVKYYAGCGPEKTINIKGFTNTNKRDSLTLPKNGTKIIVFACVSVDQNGNATYTLNKYAPGAGFVAENLRNQVVKATAGDYRCFTGDLMYKQCQKRSSNFNEVVYRNNKGQTNTTKLINDLKAQLRTEMQTTIQEKIDELKDSIQPPSNNISSRVVKTVQQDNEPNVPILELKKTYHNFYANKFPAYIMPEQNNSFADTYGSY